MSTTHLDTAAVVVVAPVLAALLLTSCVFDRTPLEQLACQSRTECGPAEDCLDGYCTRATLIDATSDTVDTDTDTDADALDIGEDTVDVDTFTMPRDPVLTRFQAEVAPAVIAPARRWTTTLTLDVERGPTDGTDLLLITQPVGTLVDLDTLVLEHEGAELDLDEAVRDGDEIQIVLADPLPDGLSVLTADIEIADDTPRLASWSVRALATEATEHDVEAEAADIDGIPDNGDSLDQEIRRLFADARAELVPTGPGFGPQVFVASSALDTHGLYEAGAPRGTLFLRFDQPDAHGVDRLELAVVPPDGQAAPDFGFEIEAVRVDGVPFTLVEADPTGEQVAVESTDGTFIVRSGEAWRDQDDDARLDVEIDVHVVAETLATGSLTLSTWLEAVPDIVAEVPEGNASGLGNRDTLDIAVWSWTTRYTHDFSTDANHDFTTDGSFDGWSARRHNNGAAHVRNGTLLVGNWLYEAAGTTVVYRDVPDYAGGALRIAADVSVQHYHDINDHSPGGTSFYFGAFANEEAILGGTLNEGHTTYPMGYGAWVFSGWVNDQIVSGHWGIVDTTSSSQMSSPLVSSDIALPSTWLDWDATEPNLRSLVAVFGTSGELDVWLFDPTSGPGDAPQMRHDPVLAPQHDPDGMIFFAMTDEGDAAVSTVRVDELVAPTP